MSDKSSVFLGGESPEQVAYRLVQDIARLEDKWTGMTFKNVDREWLLDTYKQCLAATRGHR